VLRCRVESIHVHPAKGGEEMIRLEEVELVAENGIAQDKRYFGRRSVLGQPGKRQVTLIEREQVAEHASALGCDPFAPGLVRSNIETSGLDLVPLQGQVIQIGNSAKLLIGEPRDPCEKMDRVKPGLRTLMENDRQGVLAQVISSGTIRAGDEIRVLGNGEAR
jgi:MOSC domain-containing protein YiiM